MSTSSGADRVLLVAWRPDHAAGSAESLYRARRIRPANWLFGTLGVMHNETSTPNHANAILSFAGSFRITGRVF